MGTPDFSVPTLQRLIDGPHQVIAVYSQPPRPKGRGQKVQKSPVHALAEHHHIPVFTPNSLRSDEEQRRFLALEADLAIVIAYGLILPLPILDAPVWGCVNIHASLLPRWRGAAPIQRSILAGDKETGVTIMKMDEGLDTGPILAMRKIKITEETTTYSLLEWMGENGAGDTFQCGHSNEQRLCNQNDRAVCGNAGIEWHKYSEKQYRRCRYSEDEYRLARYSGSSAPVLFTI